MPPKKTHPVTLTQGAMVIIGASLYALITSFLRIAETTAARPDSRFWKKWPTSRPYCDFSHVVSLLLLIEPPPPLF